MAIIIVIVIILFFVIMDTWTEDGRKKEEKERKQREEKRAQELIEHSKWRENIYNRALQIGRGSGINHLRRILSGFYLRNKDNSLKNKDNSLTLKLWHLSQAVERAILVMEQQEPKSNYSTQPPPIPQLIPEPFDYQAPWWKNYSTWYRDEKRWTCEKCELNLNNDRSYLHTHHIRGTQYNDPKYLNALCLGCHVEEPGYGHSQLKRESDYLQFMVKYGNLRKETLDSFYSLSLQFEVDVSPSPPID